MNCEEAVILLHAMIDGELDAGNAREVEAHIVTCSSCAARLRDMQELRKTMSPDRFALCSSGEFAQQHRRQIAGTATRQNESALVAQRLRLRCNRDCAGGERALADGDTKRR